MNLFFKSLMCICFFCLPLVRAYGEVPALTKIAIINSQKVFEVVSRSEVVRLNKYLVNVANANNIQVVFQDAAYVAPNCDITEEFIRGLKGNIPANELNLNYLKVMPSLAVINSEKVFNTSKDALEMQSRLRSEFGDGKNYAASDVEKRTLEEQAKIAGKANKYIKELAELRGYSAIFQQAAFVNPKSDITNDLIGLLNQDTSIQALSRAKPLSNTSMKIAVLNGKKIFEAWPGVVQQSVAFSGNQAIAKFAAENKIDIVFQEAAYVESSVDITESILRMMSLSPPQNGPTPSSDGRITF